MSNWLIRNFLYDFNPSIYNYIKFKWSHEPLSVSDFPVRTYVIATNIYLEINNNELHYETLIRDTTALKEFISTKFKLSRIPSRIEEMKRFSY
jgi:hypothetical protein